MRFLLLYVRSRHVPLALAAAVATVAGLWALGRAAGPERADPMLALLAVLVCAILAGSGLAGADLDLDRTAAIAWPPRRLAHVLAVGATVTGIVTATAAFGDRLAPLGQTTRDAVGMTGLVALGAVTLGASRAWIPPLGWTLVASTLLNLAWTAPLAAYQQVLTWMIQPTQSDLATATAMVLGVAGLLGYAVLGPRP
jgi:hypothetical protein